MLAIAIAGLSCGGPALSSVEADDDLETAATPSPRTTLPGKWSVPEVVNQTTPNSRLGIKHRQRSWDSEAGRLIGPVLELLPPKPDASPDSDMRSEEQDEPNAASKDVDALASPAPLAPKLVTRNEATLGSVQRTWNLPATDPPATTVDQRPETAMLTKPESGPRDPDSVPRDEPSSNATVFLDPHRVDATALADDPEAESVDESTPTSSGWIARPAKTVGNRQSPYPRTIPSFPSWVSERTDDWPLTAPASEQPIGSGVIQSDSAESTPDVAPPTLPLADGRPTARNTSSMPTASQLLELAKNLPLQPETLPLLPNPDSDPLQSEATDKDQARASDTGDPESRPEASTSAEPASKVAQLEAPDQTSKSDDIPAASPKEKNASSAETNAKNESDLSTRVENAGPTPMVRRSVRDVFDSEPLDESVIEIQPRVTGPSKRRIAPNPDTSDASGEPKVVPGKKDVEPADPTAPENTAPSTLGRSDRLSPMPQGRIELKDIESTTIPSESSTNVDTDEIEEDDEREPTSDATETDVAPPQPPLASLDATGRPKRHRGPGAGFDEDRLIASMRSPIRQCLQWYHGQRENADKRSNWGMMHAIMVYGPETQLVARGRQYSTIAWIAGNNVCRGNRLMVNDRGTLRAQEGVGLQGHQAQWLAILAIAGVPGKYPLYVGRTKFKVADLVETEASECKDGAELTFSLIGLSHYLDTEATWVNKAGESWDFQRVIASELSQPIVGAACGGTHRLMGFAHALRKRRLEHQPIDGQWLRAETYLDDFVDYTYRIQNRDGSMSTDWFESRENNGDLERQVQTTGHMVEFLLTHLADDQLGDERLTRSVHFLLRSMMNGRRRDWAIGPKGHALRSLAIYYERMYGEGPAVTSSVVASRSRRSR
ncbi:MAG: GTPase-activating protein [Planctomycetota bacterium]